MGDTAGQTDTTVETINSDGAKSSHGWFKTMRSPEAMELIKSNPMAYLLATIIAWRAKWRDGFNQYGLSQGECLLGDYENYGMSQRQYRTAKQQLTKWGFATFKTTNRGTIGKLTDTRLFDTAQPGSDNQNARQATPKRQASDNQPTTNEEGIRRNNKETRGEAPPPDSKNGSEIKAQPQRILTTSERISLEREKEQLTEERDRIKRNAAEDAWGKHYDDIERARLGEIKERLAKLETALLIPL